MVSTHHLASSQEQPDEEEPVAHAVPPVSASSSGGQFTSMALLPTSADSSFHSARSSQQTGAERGRTLTDCDAGGRGTDGAMPPPALQVTAASTPSASGSPERVGALQASATPASAPAAAVSAPVADEHSVHLHLECSSQSLTLN